MTHQQIESPHPK